MAEAGFVRVGFDHFARPGDTLASGRVHRNFQGYTTDSADALLGSPGGGGPSGGPLPGGDEDALLAWNADLQSVLSKLDILETTHESRAKAGGLGSP